MKITGIEQQVKTKGRYSVFVDDKFSFGISELGLINLSLKIGEEISAEKLADYKKSAETDKFYNLALNLIARRPRSKGELVDYLKRKTKEAWQIEEILNRLSERGYVDDQDFAHRWVESRRLLKPISKRKLIAELKQKHIKESIIKEVLDSDETDEIEIIKQEIIRKSRQTRYKDQTKLIAYLARQGYQYGDIKQALADD